MAINKKLIHFNKKTTFETERANGNILDTSIVFIKDSKEIYTHGQLYPCDTVEKNWSKITSEINSKVTAGTQNTVPNPILVLSEGLPALDSMLDGTTVYLSQSDIENLNKNKILSLSVSHGIWTSSGQQPTMKYPYTLVLSLKETDPGVRDNAGNMDPNGLMRRTYETVYYATSSRFDNTGVPGLKTRLTAVVEIRPDGTSSGDYTEGSPWIRLSTSIEGTGQ